MHKVRFRLHVHRMHSVPVTFPCEMIQNHRKTETIMYYSHPAAITLRRVPSTARFPFRSTTRRYGRFKILPSFCDIHTPVPPSPISRWLPVSDGTGYREKSYGQCGGNRRTAGVPASRNATRSWVISGRNTPRPRTSCVDQRPPDI